MALEELIGDYEGTRYSRLCDGGKWIVGKIADGTDVTGETAIDLIPGASYRFIGKYETTKYGRQFKFEHVAEAEPMSRQAVVSFLVRYCGKEGMTPRRANLAFDQYGPDCLRFIRESPRSVTAMSALPEEKQDAIAAILATQKKHMQSKIDLALLFEGKGFPRKAIDLCVEKWGARAAGIVRADPFKLLTGRIKGAGFRRCDNLYLSLGHPAAGMKRQVLSAWNAIDKNDGDTWVDGKMISNAIRSTVCSASVQPNKAVDIGVRSRWLSRISHDGVWVSTYARAKSESILAQRVAELWSEPDQWPAPWNYGGKMTDHQRTAVHRACYSRLGFLVGTPGTGKTFCVAEVIRACIHAGFGPVAIAAPTGKAAVRCSEVMRANGVQAFASSIHTLLKGRREGEGWSFLYNRSNPLPFRIVVVDEFSMVDTDLAAALFDAVDPKETHVLCVGDENQLPPVGHGAPLRDLLSLERYVGRLDEIWRNAGMIVRACRAVRDAKSIPSATKLDDTDNLMVTHAWTSASAIAQLRRCYQAMRLANKRDLMNDVQVLVPLNSQGPLSRETVSRILQEELNPLRGEGASGLYRKGDKVICLKNDYYPTPNSEDEHYIANGEMGVVVQVFTGDIVAEFPQFNAPTRVIRFREKGEFGKQFALGYAITVHKSQGSQWPVVIIIADPMGARVATREWYYTAISRAAERCIIIGDKNVVESQAKKVSLENRKTFLAEKIKASIPDSFVKTALED